MSMKGVPADHVVVDFDCRVLQMPEGKRCDYLFVAEDGPVTWVAPIELKAGAFSPGGVADQLGGGAEMADRWLPEAPTLRFVPVVAHGKGLRKERIKSLQKTTVTFRNQTRRPHLIRCGADLAPLLR